MAYITIHIAFSFDKYTQVHSVCYVIQLDLVPIAIPNSFHYRIAFPCRKHAPKI